MIPTASMRAAFGMKCNEFLESQGSQGDFRVAFETRIDANEQAALDQLKTWVTSKFGNDFKLVPSK